MYILSIAYSPILKCRRTLLPPNCIPHQEHPIEGMVNGTFITFPYRKILIMFLKEYYFVLKNIIF